MSSLGELGGGGDPRTQTGISCVSNTKLQGFKTEQHLKTGFNNQDPSPSDLSDMSEVISEMQFPICNFFHLSMYSILTFIIIISVDYNRQCLKKMIK